MKKDKGISNKEFRTQKGIFAPGKHRTRFDKLKDRKTQNIEHKT